MTTPSDGTTEDRADAFLTRTTLQTFGDASAASLAALVRALQRVPGVLLADLQATGERVIVMHDSGVPIAAFVSAAAAAGVRAAIVAGHRPIAAAPAAAASASVATPQEMAGARQFAMIALAFIVIVTFLEMLVPYIRP